MSHASTIAAHWATLLRLRGVPAVIARGEDTCEVSRVLLARADAESVTSREVRFEADLQDVICRVSDYAPAYSAPVTPSAPQTGDQITVEVAGQTVTLEVRPQSTSQQVARHTDETRQFWRISTKIVSREPVE